MKKCLMVAFVLASSVSVYAQQPKYTHKKFVNYFDTAEFKISHTDNGWTKTYILSHLAIWDVDDNNTTHVFGDEECLINIEGPFKNGKKNGIFTTYVLDSGNHSHRYKVYEQTYINDKLNGQWKVYNLKGTLVSFQTYKNDSLDGISRNYWIDGKTIMHESEYFPGSHKHIEREFTSEGKLQKELSFLGDELSGFCKEYYPDGSLNRTAFFEHGVLNGSFKYYHPGGKLWIDEIYKDGKEWTVLGNYDSNGKSREKGTLKNGNGTVYLYNEDGSLREVLTLINGEEKK